MRMILIDRNMQRDKNKLNIIFYISISVYNKLFRSLSPSIPFIQATKTTPAQFMMMTAMTVIITFKCNIIYQGLYIMDYI